MRWSSLVVVALLSCADEELGVVYAGERMPVIDMHLHPGDWDSIPPETQEFLSSRFPFPIDLRPDKAAGGVLSPAGILDEMDRAGVSGGTLLAIYAPRTVGIAANEDVIADVAHDPRRFYGLASLRVDRWNEDGAEQLQALRAALMAPGMVGIKLAHAHQQFRMDDPRFFGIYALAAELKKPVYLHTGTSPFPGTAQEPAYTDPAYLEPAIAAHPGAIFILGHLGYDFENRRPGALATCIDLAKRYDNVYLEPSALGSKGSDPTGENLRQAMASMRAAGLTDRIIYGSDGPQSPGFVAEYLERTVAAMAAADYSAAEARAVLAGNFARVFAVPEPEL
ncbi:amidohydrolase family protein [Nannocystis pusilla]|uniref:amidohydrolase family protein n=1 Tax=Nannocystis pusilla TaxID=889268 RepID=UPI003BF24C5D